MIVINKRMILFELFVVIMFFCQFRMEMRQGYILLFLELSIGCIYWLWKSKRLKQFTPLFLTYLFFITYRIVLSLMISGEGIKSIFYKELGMLFLCTLMLGENTKIDVIKRVRDFGFINALLGCYEFFTHSSIFLPYIAVKSRMFTQSLGTYRTRVQSVFMHPIICGVFMVVVWLCVLFFPYRKQLLNYLARISIFLCLLGTQSRSSWIAFVLVNTIYIIKKRKGKGIRLKKSNVAQACAVVFLTLIIVIIFNEYIKHICQIVVSRWMSGMNSNDAGNYNRVTMIKMGIQEWMKLGIGKKIFGSGNGYAYTFLFNHPIRGWSGAVDNQYLTVLLDFGLVGFMMLIFMIAYILKKIFTCGDNINQLCGLSILSMFISGFFYEMFSWITVSLLFCLFLCILEQENREKERYV